LAYWWKKRFGSALGLFIVLTVVATVAAFIKMAIGLASGNGWELVTFFQDLTQNFFIAVVIVVITEVLTDYQERVRKQHEQRDFVLKRVKTIATFIGLPSGLGQEDSDVIEMIRNKASVWGDLGSELRRFTSGDLSERHKAEQMGLSSIPELLSLVKDSEASATWTEVSGRIRVTFAGDGDRKQRSIYLRYLVDDLATIASTGEKTLAQEAKKCRDCAIDLSAKAQLTDAMVENFLGFSRLSQPNSETQAIFGLYPGDLDALTSVTDSVKLLLAFCDEVSRRIQSDPDIRVTRDSLFSSAKVPLEALSFELDFAGILGECLATLLSTAATL